MWLSCGCSCKAGLTQQYAAQLIIPIHNPAGAARYCCQHPVGGTNRCWPMLSV
jgi:hypothetical protein